MTTPFKSTPTGDVIAAIWAAFLLCVALLVMIWIVPSIMESRTFTRLTGREVSTWDAMWVDLRVVEPVAPSKLQGDAQ